MEHIKVMHTEQPPVEKIPKFICELCGKAFHKRVSLTVGQLPIRCTLNVVGFHFEISTETRIYAHS